MKSKAILRILFCSVDGASATPVCVRDVVGSNPVETQVEFSFFLPSSHDDYHIFFMVQFRLKSFYCF